MTATCLSDGKQVEVIKYKNIYYCEIDFYCPYKTFIRTNKEVKEGHEYAHYMIDGKLYKTCYTNDLEHVAKDIAHYVMMKRYSFKKYRILKKYKQLSIFDLEDEE